MHIVFFTINITKGGAERVISNLCNNLVEKYRLSIVTYHPLECCYELNRRIQIYSLEMPIIQHPVKKFLDLKTAKKRFLKKMSDIKPDVVIAFLPRPCMVACSVRKKLNVPVIGSIRSNPEMDFKNIVYRMIAKKTLSLADGFVFQTEDAQKFFPMQLQKKSIIIMNPINDEAARIFHEGERTKRIVSVGRFVNEKNYPLLIRAFAKLSKKYQDYNLWIYGKYDERLRIKELAESLGVSKRVVFAGQKDNIYNEICDASLFVLSSKTEGMPNALMEAMVMGIPVIATDCPCGGPRALIQNRENGVLVPNEDEEALTQAMDWMLSNRIDAEEMGRKAREIRKLCSGQKIYGEWEDYILSRLLKHTK